MSIVRTVLTLSLLLGACLASIAQSASTVLITGSNRGIGFEFAKQYAQRGWNVIATCRDPAGAVELNALAAENDALVVKALDVTDNDQIVRLALEYADQPIDVLINNAGLVDLSPRQDFGQIDYELMDRMLDVNTLGPLRVAEAFADHVVKSDTKKLVNITSAAGSTGSINRPAFMGYRASKAALNSMMKNLSLVLAEEGVIVGLINPGVVDTRGILDMTEETAPPEYRQAVKMVKNGRLKMRRTPDAVNSLIAIIDGITAEDSGRFMDQDGSTLPW